MPNTIANKIDYVAVQDAFYKNESQTAELDTPAEAVKFLSAKQVKYRDITTQGLHDHGSNSGASNITVAWNTYELDYDRNATLTIDEPEEDEAAGGAVLMDAVEQFMNEFSIPEVDAYRFAKYGKAALTAGHDAQVDLDDFVAGDAKKAVEAGILAMVKAGCKTPVNTWKCYTSPEFQALLDADFNRTWTNEDGVQLGVSSINGMKVKPATGVFSTEITLGNGVAPVAKAGGYPINFLIVDPSSVLQCTTHVYGNYFPAEGPNAYQGGEAGQAAYQYRNVGGAMVRANKTAGVYVHTAETATPSA